MSDRDHHFEQAYPLRGGESVDDSNITSSERYINHLVLSQIFDFIPKIQFGVPYRTIDIQDRSYAAFPVEKIEGLGILSYIRKSEGRRGFAAVLQLAKEYQQLLQFGIFIPDRPVNIIVDDSGKVWHVDLENTFDLVSERKLSTAMTMQQLRLSSERVSNLNPRQMRSLHDKDKYYAEHVRSICIAYFNHNERKMTDRQREAWISSSIQPVEEFSTISLSQLIQALIKLESLYSQ